MESVLSAQTAFVNVVSEQNARVNRVHEENAALKARVMQLEMLNSLHMLAEEKRRNQRFCEGAPRRKIEYFQGPNAPSANNDLIYHLDQLLTVICNDVESGAHAKSLYSVLEQYYLFSDKALAQAAHLSETPDFRRWLLDKNSGSLLVDGHCGEHMSHMISPLSVFCATLVQSLLDMSLNSQDMVLYFFCGQHVYADGPLSGPQGLIRSLTAQIILGLGSRHIAPELEFLRELPGLASSSHPEDIDIRTVGRIFSGLLSQLPPGTSVHCVVDDISQFETALYGWAEDLGIVVDCLQWCVFNTDASVFLKPLYTSANASTVVRRQIPLDQQLDLRSGEYYGSVSSPRALMMDLSNQLSFSESEDEQSEREQIRIRYHGTSGE
ncbi:hypothetical protein Daus18300_011240 [Diaporthe australafricana]|uniref:Uncharacterized protein n=1 Tax=Diaporthe australafricana TaxID=127596 RepID=A0ABR3W769_9PEZI